MTFTRKKGYTIWLAANKIGEFEGFVNGVGFVKDFRVSCNANYCRQNKISGSCIKDSSSQCRYSR